MANNSEKQYWKLDGEKIVIKNRSYSIFYITVLSFSVKVISLGLVAYSLASFMVQENVASIASAGLAFFTFLTGFLIGKIANKANDMYLDALEKKAEENHKMLLKNIRNSK